MTARQELHEMSHPDGLTDGTDLPLEPECA